MHKKITIITGEINSGKTTQLKHLIETFTDKRVGGVIAEGLFDNCKDRKSGFTVRSLESGESRLLLSEVEVKGMIPVGRFWMSGEVLTWACDQIKYGINGDIIVIDEIGHLELQCKGYYDVLKLVLDEFLGELILVIRKELILQVQELFCLDPDGIDLIQVENRKRQEIK